MLDRNQETRIKTRDVLKHKWITGIDERTEDLKLRQTKSSESLLSNLSNSSSSKKQTNQMNKKLNEKLSNMNKVYKSSLVIPVLILKFVYLIEILIDFLFIRNKRIGNLWFNNICFLMNFL